MKANVKKAVAYIRNVAGIDVSELKVVNRAGTESYAPSIEFVVQDPSRISTAVLRRISRKLGTRSRLVRRRGDFGYGWDIPASMRRMYFQHIDGVTVIGLSDHS